MTILIKSNHYNIRKKLFLGEDKNTITYEEVKDFLSLPKEDKIHIMYYIGGKWGLFCEKQALKATPNSTIAFLIFKSLL